MVASAGPRTQVAFTAIPVCGAPGKCWWVVVGGGRRAAGGVAHSAKLALWLVCSFCPSSARLPLGHCVRQRCCFSSKTGCAPGTEFPLVSVASVSSKEALLLRGYFRDLSLLKHTRKCVARCRRLRSFLQTRLFRALGRRPCWLPAARAGRAESVWLVACASASVQPFG